MKTCKTIVPKISEWTEWLLIIWFENAKHLNPGAFTSHTGMPAFERQKASLVTGKIMQCKKKKRHGLVTHFPQENAPTSVVKFSQRTNRSEYPIKQKKKFQVYIF